MMNTSIDTDLPGGWTENADLDDFDISIVGSELPDGWPDDDLVTEPIEQVIDGTEEGDRRRPHELAEKIIDLMDRGKTHEEGEGGA